MSTVYGIVPIIMINAFNGVTSYYETLHHHGISIYNDSGSLVRYNIVCIMDVYTFVLCLVFIILAFLSLFVRRLKSLDIPNRLHLRFY